MKEHRVSKRRKGACMLSNPVKGDHLAVRQLIIMAEGKNDDDVSF
jgi:hypothetical protein